MGAIPMTDPTRRARHLRRIAARACFRRLRRNLARLWTLPSLWIERSRQRSELARLDDRILRDLGATRYDVSLEISKPFWRE